MQVPRSIAEIDLDRMRQGSFFPSPAAWEDQVLYFLMLDRFSDGREDGYLDASGERVAGRTPPFQPGDEGSATRTEADARAWRDAGAGWVGGKLAGVESKLGYLSRLGVTAIWISPVFRQTQFEASYHGYGIQNFLDVDPHFGTTEDLRRLVRTAHEVGIRVILDIILNHAGNVFTYDPDRYPEVDEHGRPVLDPRWDGRHYRVAGFNDAAGLPTIPFARADLQSAPPADGGVWPVELFDPATFTCRGRISSWDHHPEYLEGDFFSLKDITLGAGQTDHYRPSPALIALTRVYQYWIAAADIDGYRVDTVKHMDPGAARFFASSIHEFAQSIGKENLYLIGEITGGRRRAYETLEVTGLDAALGIDDIPDKLEWGVKGWRDPSEYFQLFRNSFEVGKDSHTWFKNRVVTLYDDHDQVRKGGSKARFCADDAGRQLAVAVLALNASTLGIPCIYYGSEQGLDGHGDNDRYIREAMFGGSFGPFRSRDRHVFDEEHPIYRRLSDILRLRAQHISLRRGRQYLRDISSDGVDFGPPRLVDGPVRSVVAWSRIFADRETLLAINTDPHGLSTAWVTVDASLQPDGRKLTCLYSTDPDQAGQHLEVRHIDGRAAVLLTVPPAGFVAYQ